MFRPIIDILENFKKSKLFKHEKASKDLQNRDSSVTGVNYGLYKMMINEGISENS